MKTIVNGSSSGLGKYLLEEFNAIAYKRNNEEESKQLNQYDDIENIIHCAFTYELSTYGHRFQIQL